MHAVNIAPVARTFNLLEDLRVIARQVSCPPVDIGKATMKSMQSVRKGMAGTRTGTIEPSHRGESIHSYRSR